MHTYIHVCFSVCMYLSLTTFIDVIMHMMVDALLEVCDNHPGVCYAICGIHPDNVDRTNKKVYIYICIHIYIYIYEGIIRYHHHHHQLWQHHSFSVNNDISLFYLYIHRVMRVG
jgi:hypothetical protein